MGALDHLNLVISDFKLFLQLVFFKSLITVTLAVLHVQTLNQVKCLCGIVSDYIRIYDYHESSFFGVGFVDNFPSFNEVLN